MDVKYGNPVPTRSTRYPLAASLAAALSDPERVMHKKLNGSLSYETAKPHESAGINMGTAAAFNSRM